MHEEVEKSLVVGGLLISLGVGGLAGFWAGVLVAGVLLFGVAFLVFVVALRESGVKQNTAGTAVPHSLDGYSFDGRGAA